MESHQESRESGELVERDDYDLFIEARNKDIEALAEAFASLRRQQRVMKAMSESYLSQVPETRREGVRVALEIHQQNLEGIEKRFIETVRGVERAQQELFDARMRMDTESQKLVEGTAGFLPVFGRGRALRARQETVKRYQESVSAVRSSMSSWSQSLSLGYRLLPVWRQALTEMLSFLETQKEEYRAVEQEVSREERDAVRLVEKQQGPTEGRHKGRTSAHHGKPFHLVRQHKQRRVG